MDLSSRLCILAGPVPSISAKAEGTAFGGYDKYLLESSLAKAGLDPSKVKYMLMSPSATETINNLNRHDLSCIVALGDKPLEFLTGLSGIDKWQLSPLDTLPTFNCHKVIPTFDFSRMNRQFDMRFFFQKALLRAASSLYNGPWKRKPTSPVLVQDEYEVLEFLSAHETHDTYAVDIETSRGTINTLGFAWNKHQGVAIRCNPGHYTKATQFRLWCWARNILENPRVKKILQNNIYEGTYFARYGIQLRGIWHDTMFAQKFMYPEFPQDLATIGRLYTNEVYWKEDGKDWGNINNWEEHLLYNVKDTTGTFEAAVNQREELQERGMLEFYDSYLVKLSEPLIEMCSTGLMVDEKVRAEKRGFMDVEITELASTLSQRINHRSWQHKKKLLEGKGYKLPTKKNAKGKRAPSTDELSLKKLRQKFPEDQDIVTLLKLAKLEKFKSSYLDFDYHDDSVVRYSLRATGTETLRFAGGTDSWEMGFNPQTIPKKAKELFLPPEGHYFVQADLQKAESWYVAHRAKELTLLEMLHSGKDVHSYVASNIFAVPMEQVISEAKSGDNSKRQLGKKSGHGGNYAMQAPTFMDNCFKEDLVLTLKEAENALEGYHRAFPRIRAWHAEIKDQIRTKGYLETVMGFRRYFYGRHNDDTFREAYAFEPQATIPMITNHLMFYLLKQRDYGVIDFNLHLQVHDSLVLSCTEKHLETIMKACKNVKLWHPRCTFPVTGDMWIGVDTEFGKENLGKLTAYE